MAPSSKDLVQRNIQYAKTHQPLPLIADIQASGAPAPKTCIITCVDPRVFPEQILGLNVGEAFIFRTVAGHPQPVFENVIGLDVTSHGFEDVILLYHTDCGAKYFDEDRIRAELHITDSSAAERIDHLDIGTIKTTEEDALRSDMKWLKEQALLRADLRPCISGYIFDLKSGLLREVQ